MKEITLTINGIEVKGKEGDTVLEVCLANGINVPTLCHLDGLSDIGACRMCVVEIEKERRPVPSCTYPARDGLVVTTDSEKLERYRRQILELIFTEHNHFCMFCEVSGDCELQKLAYRYQMDHVRYQYTFPTRLVDTISDYIVIDHNRCVLCGRCIRTCGEIAASHTLSFSQRGWKTVVSADLGQSLGESSCRLCGACTQSCPTGALFSKQNLYKGRKDDCQQVKTACVACGVGCELNVMVKDNNLIKIESPDLTGDLRGSLCQIGRFKLLDPTPPRITHPMVRDAQGNLGECALEKAAQVIADKINESKHSFAGLASTRMPSETLSLFNNLITEVAGSNSIDTFDGEYYRLINEGIRQFQGNGTDLNIECSIDDILDADCIMVISADPQVTNPIVSTAIRRAISRNNARLIVINPEHDVFPLLTDLWLKPRAGSEGILLEGLAKSLVKKHSATSKKVSQEFVQSLNETELDEVLRSTGINKASIELLTDMYGQADNAVIIYGDKLLQMNGASSVATILNIAAITGNTVGDKLRVISLKPNGNSRGAWALGMAKGIKGVEANVLYMLLGDEPINDQLLRQAMSADFLIVQAAYQSPIIDMADVVLPSLTWAERSGTCVAMDGRAIKLQPVLQLSKEQHTDEDLLKDISNRLSCNLV